MEKPTVAAWRPRRQTRDFCEHDYRSESMKREEHEAEVDVCRILDDDLVFLSSLKGAGASRELSRREVRRILSVAGEGVQLHVAGSFEVKKITIEDMEYCDILSRAVEASDFIEDGRCLVHCEQGMSRSAFMMVAHCMLRKHMPLADAWERVKARRTMVSPNDGFRRQLRVLQQLLEAAQLKGRKLGGADIYDTPLYDLYLAEHKHIDRSTYRYGRDIRVDPSAYARIQDEVDDTRSTPGIACGGCSRVLCTPLNTFGTAWLEGGSDVHPAVEVPVAYQDREKEEDVVCDCEAPLGTVLRTSSLCGLDAPLDLLPPFSLLLTHHARHQRVSLTPKTPPS